MLAKQILQWGPLYNKAEMISVCVVLLTAYPRTWETDPHVLVAF